MPLQRCEENQINQVFISSLVIPLSIQVVIDNPIYLKVSLKYCKKMSTITKVNITPDEEETPVNTERVLTLMDVWNIKSYRHNIWFLDQFNLGNFPLAFIISPIECSLCCIGTRTCPWKVLYII